MSEVASGTAMLSAVGLSELEVRLYEVLVETGGVSLAEAACAVGMPLARARKTLSSLEARGLVSPSPGKRPRFLPAPPRLAIEALILRRQEELEQVRLAASQLGERLRDAKHRNDAAELVEVVNGRDAFRQRYLQLLSGARKELLALDKPPHITPEAECNDRETECLTSGVKWRGIYDRETLEVPGKLDAISKLSRAGEEARILRGVPLKLAIADRRSGLIPLDLRPGFEEAVLVHASPLLDALTCLFETLWERATPVILASRKDSQPGEEADLSEKDERIIVLLAAGLKDEAIARQLGLGFSTVERRIRRMMQMVGADTRVQLGLRIAERGWLNGPNAPDAGRHAG